MRLVSLAWLVAGSAPEWLLPLSRLIIITPVLKVRRTCKHTQHHNLKWVLILGLASRKTNMTLALSEGLKGSASLVFSQVVQMLIGPTVSEVNLIFSIFYNNKRLQTSIWNKRSLCWNGCERMNDLLVRNLTPAWRTTRLAVIAGRSDWEPDRKDETPDCPLHAYHEVTCQGKCV